MSYTILQDSLFPQYRITYRNTSVPLQTRPVMLFVVGTFASVQAYDTIAKKIADNNYVVCVCDKTPLNPFLNYQGVVSVIQAAPSHIEKLAKYTVDRNNIWLGGHSAGARFAFMIVYPSNVNVPPNTNIVNNPQSVIGFNPRGLILADPVDGEDTGNPYDALNTAFIDSKGTTWQTYYPTLIYASSRTSLIGEFFYKIPYMGQRFYRVLKEANPNYSQLRLYITNMYHSDFVDGTSLIYLSDRPFTSIFVFDRITSPLKTQFGIKAGAFYTNNTTELANMQSQRVCVYIFRCFTFRYYLNSQPSVNELYFYS